MYAVYDCSVRGVQVLDPVESVGVMPADPWYEVTASTIKVAPTVLVADVVAVFAFEEIAYAEATGAKAPNP
jgi:hypothetical protein